MDQHLPLFFFTIREVRVHSAAPPRHSSSGQWRPPRPAGHSILDPDAEGYHHTTSYSYNTATHTIFDLRTPDPRDQFEGLQQCRAVTLYFEGATIWCIGVDATQHIIGNGRPANLPDEDDDDEDADGSDDEGAAETDWQPIHFNHIAGGSTQIDYGLEQTRLFASRNDQTWQDMLLPTGYRPIAHRRNIPNRVPPYGSLSGNLAILLGLVALTADPDEAYHVHMMLQHCIQGQNWQTPLNNNGC
ncbi:hypothetical protein BT63DRAFT_73821 [Microthyrium microscopicum]|uniref:Uncharacterized protein n=1 Tax=Microthyrium microscopicum TaxID=703497 RepID=A0A6A6U1D3_9PEZI|nr:hypothetical protein BT63DRAFT_73821 [Microthyrium microscopicum]